MCSPDSWRMSLSCWYCWFLSWPFKNIEWVCNSVYCTSVRGCRGHPSASVQWRQTAERPSWKGTGGGWWRTRIAGGHHGSAPPCSSPYLAAPTNTRAGREAPIRAGAQTSAVPPGAFPPDNEPSWHRAMAAVLLHYTTLLRTGLWTQ